MSTVYINATHETEIRQLIQSAVQREIARLELALATARKRLIPFEEKYGVSSEQFMRAMAAEDLEGGDDEYITWAGEYQLMQRLEQKLSQLEGIEYGDSNLLYPDKSPS